MRYKKTHIIKRMTQVSDLDKLLVDQKISIDEYALQLTNIINNSKNEMIHNKQEINHSNNEVNNKINYEINYGKYIILLLMITNAIFIYGIYYYYNQNDVICEISEPSVYEVVVKSLKKSIYQLIKK
jgi:hypothetical protein